MMFPLIQAAMIFSRPNKVKSWRNRFIKIFAGNSERSSKESIEARYLAELSDLRQREKALIERAVDVVCTVDSFGSFVFVSPSCKSAWGYSPQEIQRNPASLVVDDEGYSRIITYAKEADKSIEKVVFEAKIRCKDGSIKTTAWRGQWSISEKTLFCIVHDMTEQKQIEESLRASEQQLKQILEHLPAGILLMNQEGVIEFANVAARSDFGCDSQTIIGKTVDEFVTDEFPARQLKLGLNDRLIIKTDGRTLPVETHCEPIVLGIEKKQILLFVDKSALYDLEKNKQDFFTMVAHDLRAPLTSLRNLVVLIEEGVLDKRSEEGTRVSNQVNLECAQLLRLVQDMVDLGKLGSSSFLLDCGLHSAEMAVSSAVETVRPVAEQNRISIAVTTCPVEYWGDELRINQILTNLLSNAIKHSKANSQVVVKVEMSESKFAKFSVKDCGPGVPAEKQEKIFDMYEQLPSHSGEPVSGAGLGLAICKKIVHHHGGQIGVESGDSSGSLFWFTVPSTRSD
jgi:PAS domain S-box-containing protein